MHLLTLYRGVVSLAYARKIFLCRLELLSMLFNRKTIDYRKSIESDKIIIDY